MRPEFIHDAGRLRARFRFAAVANLLLSPFLFVFLLIYFFMHNAERFYSHPGSLSSRRWSSLAKWTIRELNEAPHYAAHRLAASHAPATRYGSRRQRPTLSCSSVERARQVACCELGLFVPLSRAWFGFMLCVSWLWMRRIATSTHPLRYLSQFPSHMVGSVCRFVAFVMGSFAALLLLLTFLDETLLERALFGRHLV